MEIALAIQSFFIIFLIYKNHRLMETNNQGQASLDRANKALDNAAIEKQADEQQIQELTAERDALKELVKNAGMPADQEEVLLNGIDSLAARIEGMTKADESAPVQDPPAENGDGSEI